MLWGADPLEDWAIGSFLRDIRQPKEGELSTTLFTEKYSQPLQSLLESILMAEAKDIEAFNKLYNELTSAQQEQFLMFKLDSLRHDRYKKRTNDETNDLLSTFDDQRNERLQKEKKDEASLSPRAYLPSQVLSTSSLNVPQEAWPEVVQEQTSQFQTTIKGRISG